MKLNDAIKALNGNHENKDALAALRKEVGPFAVLVKDEGGKLDAAEILDALRHCERTGDTGVPGGQTVTQWLAERAPEQEACPVTRRPLYKGKVQVERPPLPPLVVDWSGISCERRLVAAYRAEVQGFSDPDLAAAALRMADLPLDWRTAERDQRELFAVQKPTSHQRDLRERVEARLAFQKGPAPAAPVVAPTPSPLGVMDAPDTNTAPLFVILCDDRSRSYLADLRSHLSLYVRKNILRVWGLDDIPPGAIRSALIGRKLAEAKVVVHLCDARYLSSSLPEEAMAAAPTARHAPVILSECEVRLTFGDKRPLPRNEKPITAWGDRDSAWSDVAQGLRQIAADLS